MQLKSAIAAAIGVAALAIGGTAMAQTNLDAVAGDVFLNIVDTNNNTSFLYDTGITQAQFGSGTGSYSLGLSGNSTYQQFVTAAGGSLTGAGIDYSVYSVTNNSSGPVILFTSNSPLAGTAANANTVAQATAALTGFLPGANANNTATTPLPGSAILGVNNYFGQGSVEGVLQTNLLASGGTDNAAIGTALTFYDTSAGAGRIATYNGVTTEPSTWNLSSAGLLTYNTVSAVPLPTPLLLLLSGLGFMGVVARRNKAA
jgi:hypothetical protein